MFERFSITLDQESIKDILKIEPTDSYSPVYNASPTMLLPVVTNLEPNGFSYFFWGIPPEWSKSKSVSKKLLNAFKEELLTRKSYSDPFKKRRCLIPADGIYGWKKISKKGKVPYRYVKNNQAPFWMAGLWDEFDGEDGKTNHVFIIITLESNSLLKPVFDEMPAIINLEDANKWLDNNTSEEELLQLLGSFNESEMGSFPVSININNTEYQGRDLLKPAPPIDQFGNYSLFD